MFVEVGYAFKLLLAIKQRRKDAFSVNTSFTLMFTRDGW